MERVSLRTVLLAAVVWTVIALFFTAVKQPVYFAAFIGSMAAGGAVVLADLMLRGRKVVRSGRVRPNADEGLWLLGLVTALAVLAFAVAQGMWDLHAGLLVLGVLVATAVLGDGI